MRFIVFLKSKHKTQRFLDSKTLAPRILVKRRLAIPPGEEKNMPISATQFKFLRQTRFEEVVQRHQQQENIFSCPVNTTEQRTSERFLKATFACDEGSGSFSKTGLENHQVHEYFCSSNAKKIFFPVRWLWFDASRFESLLKAQLLVFKEKMGSAIYKLPCITCAPKT